MSWRPDRRPTPMSPYVVAAILIAWFAMLAIAAVLIKHGALS